MSNDKKVGIIVAGEVGSNIGTTVLDATSGEVEIVREGLNAELL